MERRELTEDPSEGAGSRLEPSSLTPFIYIHTYTHTKQMWQKVTIWHKQKIYTCSLYYSFNCFGKLKIFPNVKFKK